MSLRYSFRHLFYGGKIHKERLYKVLEDLDSANGGETTDISALKTTVGDNKSGLVKKTADIETAIGSESTEGTILARIKALETAQASANNTEQTTTEPSG